MKKIFIILLIISGMGMMGRLNAQVLNLDYNMSVPLGDSHDFVSKMSFRGFSLDYHQFVTEHWGFGLKFGWNTYYKHLDYTTGNFLLGGKDVTITGDQFRYLNVAPLMASVRYQFTKDDAFFLPYVALGIGTNWAETRLEIGDLVAQEKGWQFAFAPEVGVIIPFCEWVGMHVGAQYHYSAKTSRLPALQDISFKVGLAFHFQ